MTFPIAKTNGIIFVGDRHQCQPAGTIVRMTGGTVKPIEEIRVGDEVVSFDRNAACLVGRVRQGKKVTSVGVRQFQGTMISIGAGDKETKCTKNHKWTTRFITRDKKLWVTYLMKKGSWFQVGWCQLFTEHGMSHLTQRTKLERAENAWILGVHHSKRKASIKESQIATIYGLPLVQFKQRTDSRHYTDEFISEFFDGLPEKVIAERANQCLEDFGRSIEFPFYTIDLQQRQARTTVFVTQACNLIPEIMAIPVDTGEREPQWMKVSIKSEYNSCEVYSLQVEKDEHYIADGLVTHNSIYGFR
jgi:DNA helicase II / ATP-dependent DNA helicase PcrA